MKPILKPIFLAILAAVFCVGAFAASKSMSVDILSPAQVNGTMLQPGHYKVELKEAGASTEVSFKLNGKQVATATGQVKQLPSASQTTKVITDNAGGKPTIAEIDFGGTTTGVTFGAASSPQGAQ